MPVMKKFLGFLCWILMFMPGAFCYNVDTKFPIVYQEGPLDNYFGFSVGLLRNSHGYWALITAPRANSSVVNLHQPGALFSCSVATSGGDSKCREVVVDEIGNVPGTNAFSGVSYTNKRDDMWLGVSLDIQRDTMDVVVCGHLWKNNLRSNDYSIKGACYVLDRDLDTNAVSKIVPFVDTGRNFNTRYHYYYENAQAGASAAFSEDGLYLLLGSPGYNDWRGTFASYQSGQYRDPIIPVTEFSQRHAVYMGYSITSGQFFGDGIIYRATGAPRDNDYRGRVYIFRPSQRLFRSANLEGKQIGEYFGASVSGIDLNGDDVTDLLVGAPFYSQENGGDEGKVYVYIGTKRRSFIGSYDLIGDNKPGARFGTCIGNVGDLNQDGFNDVAIGAPYEDEKGAVYIYCGRINGIHREYAQRIGAEDFRPLFSGFGISISRGLDIDNNSYPDILIGSYASSNAVLLRTYPVIRLRSTLSFNVQKINMNTTACDVRGFPGKVSCVTVRYCVGYSGEHVASTLGFQTELRIDTARRNSAATGRGFFLSDGKTQPQPSISRKMRIRIEPNRSCSEETAYFYKNISDEITPVEFLLKYDLDRSSTDVCQGVNFTKDCPVIHPASPTNVTKQISFEINCKNNSCQADLSVEAYIVGNPRKRILVVGQNETLILDATLRNSGEPAYVTELFIALPAETPPVRYDDRCETHRNQEEYSNTSLRCSFRNFLKNGEAVNVYVEIDVKSIPAETSLLAIYFRATTASEDINKSNNDATLLLDFQTAADFNITGNPENPRIPQTEERGTVSITHNYYVKYYGPSPVDKIDIYLYVPYALKGENGFLTFLSISDFVPDSGDISTQCNFTSTQVGFKSGSAATSEENPYGETQPPGQGSEPPEVGDSNTSDRPVKSDAEEKATDSTAKQGQDYTLDCETAKCEVIHCNASPFRSGQKSIKFILTVQVDLDLLSSVMEMWNSIKFVTKGEISTNGVKMLSDIYRNETTVETAIVQLRHPGAEAVPKWIIFVSIGVGLILLLIILVALIKIGFFKRKQRDKMRSMRGQVHLKDMQEMSAPDTKETADDNTLCPKPEKRD